MSKRALTKFAEQNIPVDVQHLIENPPLNISVAQDGLVDLVALVTHDALLRCRWEPTGPPELLKRDGAQKLIDELEAKKVEYHPKDPNSV
ncbi:hypothetical protein [Bradyrhizobium sp. JYMT SZCCT0428]|uniref:hypothetical protein n=1 Tax=Bradyrhizobium sp. JYMT SZCCT0428 TaxID=2807673 RepID=UPI001BAE0B9F|nr:hypothetical protein [Bradyrhizobium sp. JYMT SZCCT0428]MBR1153953.1 hypothetical protein [Bradyrhizobium sp. JYMT SZCCT0428]